MIQSTLNKYGYNNIESLCTEWNSSPFGNVNTYSKVQSSKNAAYITSTFIYMQYTKVDLAHYYRGDASSFGLFNDEPGFCTYAGQAFSLYSKMFETPNLLTGDKDFSTGLTVLACDNDQDNLINVLAANYIVERDFSTENPPRESPIYKQHYVDGNRSINQLTDSWSLHEWFGDINPNTINPDNVVTQNNPVQQLPGHGSLSAKTRNYTESNTGLNIQINNVGYTAYSGTSVEAFNLISQEDVNEENWRKPYRILHVFSYGSGRPDSAKSTFTLVRRAVKQLPELYALR